MSNPALLRGSYFVAVLGEEWHIFALFLPPLSLLLLLIIPVRPHTHDIVVYDDDEHVLDVTTKGGDLGLERA